MGSKQLTSSTWWGFQYLQNISKNRARNIAYSPWVRAKGSWLCLMAKVLCFCLAWLFSFLHFLTFLVKFIPWLKLFYRQKAGGRHGLGSVLGSPHRVLVSYARGWYSCGLEELSGFRRWGTPSRIPQESHTVVQWVSSRSGVDACWSPCALRPQPPEPLWAPAPEASDLLSHLHFFLTGLGHGWGQAGPEAGRSGPPSWVSALGHEVHLWISRPDHGMHAC